jgi:hypothetical protein
MEPDTRRELEAAVGACRELGREHEDELIDGFLERLDKRLVQQGAQREKALKQRRDYQKEMILGAMGVSIPLLVIAGIFGGVAGIALVCAALAVIAVVVSRSS